MNKKYLYIAGIVTVLLVVTFVLMPKLMKGFKFSSLLNSDAFILSPVEEDPIDNLMIMVDGTQNILPTQRFMLLDRQKNLIDTSDIESLEIKYPGEPNFYEAGAYIGPEGIILDIPIFLVVNPGEYAVRINYKTTDVPLEESIQWDGLVSEVTAPSFEINETSGDLAIDLSTLDLDSTSSLYYKNFVGLIEKKAAPFDQYLTIPKSKLVTGRYEFLVRKNGSWYRFFVNI